ncbi:MAG: helix-turn-helix transcriptional regulator [Actinobacteria bacterium]|nr:helix-turn-helix transcriptional regulator [Actinomycetota bacterium]
MSSPGVRHSALRVLAHPLRSRVLAELRVHGRATATELAGALDTHTGATSYHLRRLEEVGLVHDTGTGTGRRRIWEARAEPAPRPDASEGPQDEDDASAAQWLALDYLEHFGERARGWVEHRAQWPAPWQVAGLEDHLVQVSAEQLTALRAELVEVLERYRRVGQGNPAAKRVVVYTCALPIDASPRTGPRPDPGAASP